MSVSHGPGVPGSESATGRPRGPSAADEFYVGYLPVPPGLRRFLAGLVAVLLLAAVGAAVLIAGQQRSPGDGVWQADEVGEFVGLAVARPYAMLIAPGADADGPPRTFLLVGEGKFGARERIEPLAGRFMRIKATRLDRGGRSMLEIASADDAVQALEGTPPPSLAKLAAQRDAQPQPAGRVTLRGEIIDPKCYLGAMKPGGGKTHKACAVLCLRGGIPPMFVTRDERMNETFYLLTDADGGPLVQDRLAAVLEFVGEPVELSGVLTRTPDLAFLALSLDSIRRL